MHTGALFIKFAGISTKSLFCSPKSVVIIAHFAHNFELYHISNASPHRPMIAESFPAGLIPIRGTVSEIFGIWQRRV